MGATHLERKQRLSSAELGPEGRPRPGASGRVLVRRVVELTGGPCERLGETVGRCTKQTRARPTPEKRELATAREPERNRESRRRRRRNNDIIRVSL